MLFLKHAAVVALMAMGLGSAAQACEGWGCDWSQKSAYGEAGAGGSSGVGFDAEFSWNDSATIANATVYTNTKPRADANAELDQFVEGQAASTNYLEGGLYQSGSTFTYADDGRWCPEAAGTSTYGMGQVGGGAFGDNSVVMADLYAMSYEESSATDGRHGGASAAASQEVGGTIVSLAEGYGSAETGNMVSVSSSSSAYTGAGGEKGE